MNKNNYTVHVKLTKEEYEKLKNKAKDDVRTINNLIYKTLKKEGLI